MGFNLITSLFTSQINTVGFFATFSTKVALNKIRFYLTPIGVFQLKTKPTQNVIEPKKEVRSA